MTTLVPKRSYNRRTEEDRIRELQEKVALLKARMEARQREDLGLVRAWPKLKKQLLAFADRALANKREDVAVSAQAFVAGIERTLEPHVETVRLKRPRKPGGAEQGESEHGLA
jgi:hypothetical protein